MEADQDRDGKISFEEFTKMVEGTDVSMSMTLGKSSNCPIRRIPNVRTCPVKHHIHCKASNMVTTLQS